jgi:hypothetical protein
MIKSPYEPSARRSRSLTERIQTIRDLNEINAAHERRRNSIRQIVDALVAAGYQSLDNQAKALGVHRSTAWTIISTRHKVGPLNAKTTTRILTNPETPESIRALVRNYLSSTGTQIGSVRRM